MWQYQYHQIEGAEWALKTIRQYGMAYLSWQERTRKTGTALLTVENSKAQSCLIISKKNALSGWDDHFNNLPLVKSYTLINYESVYSRSKNSKGKLVYKLKYNPKDYDFIILDEAHHAISGVPKPSTTWKMVKELCLGKPILFLSATPYAEHLGLIYHQLKMSDWTPFKHRTFYLFHKHYGIPDLQYTPTPRETYKVYQTDRILAKMKHLFNFKTRKEVGIKHEPTIRVIKVPLHAETKEMMIAWIKTKLLTIDGEVIPNDNPSKSSTIHYQLEGGTVKLEERSVFLAHHEKVDYIKDNYDTKRIAIMAHFIHERKLLEKHFPTVRILSSDGHAEGVDLSDIEKVIVYSMSFKTSKHTQRIARQANHDRTTPIEVDVLIADKPSIGGHVYETVAIKRSNFIRDSYNQSLRSTK